MQFECSEYKTVDASTGVLSDQVGSLVGFYNSKQYPEKLRKVVFYDVEMDRTFVYITNNLELRLKKLHCFIRTAGRSSFSSNGSDNISRSSPFGELQRMLYASKFTRSSSPIAWLQ
jgi:hypothetical protein